MQKYILSKFQYQFCFNGDFSTYWFKLIDINTISCSSICSSLVLQASESHLFVFSFSFFLQTPKKWNHILWHDLQLTGSPSLQAHEYNKSIPTYINLIPVVLSSTNFLLISMHRSELDNSRTSHHQSLCALSIFSSLGNFCPMAD